MNFASKYVLVGDRNYQVLGQLEQSSSSESSDEGRPPSPPLASARPHWKSHTARHRWKGNPPQASGEDEEKNILDADTNVLELQFDAELSPSYMLRGEPIRCSTCDAVLSHISKLEGRGAQKEWNCEFCQTMNIVTAEKEQIPVKNDVTFLLSEAADEKSEAPFLIFCIDTSDSMNEATEITAAQLGTPGQQTGTNLIGNGKVSALQVIKAAIELQINQLRTDQPGRRVGLVQFDSNVTFIIDDGGTAELHVRGNSSIEKLREEARRVAPMQSVVQTYDGFITRVRNLKTNGMTALGPGLVMALEAAAKQPGSEVVLCTDGLANVGVGAIAGNSSGDASSFYTEMADYAVEKGVTISVITLAGAQCGLAHLKILAEKSGGQLNSVSCENVSEEFQKIVQNQVKASGVKSTLIIFKELFVVDNVNPSNQESNAQRSHGNVKEKKMKTTYAFAQRKRKKSNLTNQGIRVTKASMMSADKSELSRMKNSPFQLLFEYSDKKGNQLLRAITTLQQVTDDRDLAEEEIDVDVMCTHTVQETARLASAGKFEEAKKVAEGQKRLVQSYVNSGRASPEDARKVAQMTASVGSVLDVAEERRRMIAELNDETAQRLYRMGRGDFTSTPQQKSRPRQDGDCVMF